MTMHCKHTTLAKAISGAVFLTSGLLVGCTTDDASDPSSTGRSARDSDAGTSGAGSGGSGTTPGSGGGPGTGASICDTKAIVTAPPIATFDSCSVGLNDDAATSDCTIAEIGGTSLFGGVFFYDDGTGNPTFSIVSGHTSGALGLASADPASEYGGGFGIWTTGCFDASAYDGISFWARGAAPNAGEATVTVLMAETTPAEPEAGSTNRGTCAGTSEQCKSPKFSFPVTDSWTQVHAAWSSFAVGDANGTSVTPNGDNIYQLQWDIGLAFAPDAEGNYVPQPATYDLQIDDVAFE